MVFVAKNMKLQIKRKEFFPTFKKRTVSTDVTRPQLMIFDF